MIKRVIVFAQRYLCAVAYCVYSFTIGLFFANHRALIETICVHFQRVNKPAASQTGALIPQVDLSDVAPEDVAIQIHEPMAINGNVTLLEVMAIARLIRYHNPARLFEIGTFDGRTTLNMAANSAPNVQVYTLDLPASGLHSTALQIASDDKAYIDKRISGSRYQGKDCANKITQFYGDSAAFDFSPFFGSIDFVFVDGSHSYEYAMNDSKQALKLLGKEKGVILWHDYGTPYWEGVTQALNDLYLNTDEFKNLKHIRGTSIVCLIVDQNES